ncbi:MAG: N-acetylmuramoyl-L-alanine amidase [Muribaculaceae bacterium]|nr:N-acetylmuramoyl-L-alanine amidase [Muribaculaceae bacterium]
MRKLRSILFAGLLSAAASAAFAAADAKPFTLVLDPGHGGKDYGCVGKMTNEKTIVLNVAKMLGKMVDAAYGDSVRTVFTRPDDTFISLQERAAIANRAGGDFFVSIHVNSVDKRTRGRENIHGASVYTLGLHKSESNLGVAMRENAVMELEEDYSATYQGFDPNSSESYIIFELSQDANMKQSLEMASLMQGELTGYAGRADKDVRQAGFWVLWSTSMPSVLVELDFICNPAAERFLASEKGQRKCAEALFRAFKDYYGRHKQSLSDGR